MSSVANSPAVANWALVSTARVNRHLVAVTSGLTQIARIAAVSSRSLEKAQQYAAECLPDGGKGVQCFGSHDEMLLSSSSSASPPLFDCVYVSTPNNLHVEPVMAAIAGSATASSPRCILVEKPAALRASEVDAMFAAAEAEQDVVLLEGYMNLHSEVNHLAKRLIDSGKIGDVQHMSGVFCYVEQRGGIRQETVRNGGGSVFDVGCYIVSLAQFLMGRRARTVQCVQEQSFPSSNDNQRGDAAEEANHKRCRRETLDYVELASTGTLFFDRAPGSTTMTTIPCQFHCSFTSPLQMGFAVTGTKGTLRINNPYKPSPTEPEHVTIQSEFGKAPEVFLARGAVNAPDVKHLYQAECETLSRIAIRNKKSRVAGDTGEKEEKKEEREVQREFLLSRDFSVGNAAMIEALHRSACNNGAMEQV